MYTYIYIYICTRIYLVFIYILCIYIYKIQNKYYIYIYIYIHIHIYHIHIYIYIYIHIYIHSIRKPLWKICRSASKHAPTQRDNLRHHCLLIHKVDWFSSCETKDSGAARQRSAHAHTCVSKVAEHHVCIMKEFIHTNEQNTYIKKK